jgi:hypothetical protein
MKTLIKTAGAAGLLAMAVGSASVSALPLTFLTFQQNAGWHDQDETFNGAVIGLSGLFFTNATSGNSPANTFEDMSWSSDATGATSSINILSYDSNDSVSSGDAALGDTNGNGLWEPGEFWVIDRLLQTNNVLRTSGGTVPNPLWIADTLANLYIFDDAGVEVNPALLADENSETTIEFWETRNRTTAGDCTNPNPLGTACDDIYRVAAVELAPLSFVRDGYKYTIDFSLAPGPSTPGNVTSLVCTGIALIDPPACASVAVTPGQIWVFTPEDNPGTSSLFVTMGWSAKAIPEPSMLALLGIGVLGAGFASRRRKQA